MNIFDTFLYEPIFNIIVIFYRVLGGNLGLSIISIGIVSRIILIPLTLRQTKLAESSKEFAEKSEKIKKKYKKNKEKQQEEMLKLQQEYLPAQIGGCLPLIVQFLLFIQIYRVLSNLIKEGTVAEIFNNIAYGFVPKFADSYQISKDFLGIDLSQSASTVNDFPQIIPYFVLILLVGLTQYLSFKVMTAMRKPDDKEKSKDSKKKKKDEPEDFAAIMQRSTKQATMLMPILLMFISYSLPSGLGIYLITTSTFVILQQLFLTKFKKDNTNINKEKNEDKSTKKGDNR